MRTIVLILTLSVLLSMFNRPADFKRKPTSAELLGKTLPDL
jgi:hypothetical protein